MDEALLLATDIYVLGQSPSRVIYSYSFSKKKAIDRSVMYTNPELIELRTDLIRIIHDEILHLKDAARG